MDEWLSSLTGDYGWIIYSSVCYLDVNLKLNYHLPMASQLIFDLSFSIVDRHKVDRTDCLLIDDSFVVW